MLDRKRPTVERSVLDAWGKVIRRYRQWKQLSRRELAAQAGMSPVFLGEIERGEKDPSSHTLHLISDALGVPLAELFLRVAARLDASTLPSRSDREQTSVPLGISERTEEYLDAVPPARDETAFDVYKVTRQLRTDQQVALLLLVQSLARDSR